MSWFAWFPQKKQEFVVFRKGLFSKYPLVVLVVSVVTGSRGFQCEKTNHPLPKQHPSSTPTVLGKVAGIMAARYL